MNLYLSHNAELKAHVSMNRSESFIKKSLVVEKVLWFHYMLKIESQLEGMRIACRAI